MTHGGLKFADFAPGFSAHSEWNYVTAMIGRMDDGHAAQEKLCAQFATDFGKAMKEGFRDVNGIGRIFFKGGMCTERLTSPLCSMVACVGVRGKLVIASN